jgi:hypothetical protein
MLFALDHLRGGGCGEGQKAGEQGEGEQEAQHDDLLFARFSAPTAVNRG